MTSTSSGSLHIEAPPRAVTARPVTAGGRQEAGPREAWGLLRSARPALQSLFRPTKPLEDHTSTHRGQGCCKREHKAVVRPRGKKQALRSAPGITLFSLRFEKAISERRASVGSSHPNWGFGKLAGSHRNLSHFTSHTLEGGICQFLRHHGW